MSFAELAMREINLKKNLLGDRFLCIGGIMLFVAPTGVGKSTALYKMTASWSRGLSAFDIEPSRPLKILVIQGENDEDDMTEYVRDCVEDIRVAAEGGEKSGWTQLHNNTVTVRINTLRGFNFIIALRELLDVHRPDLVLIDPLNCYSGTDPSNASEITTFLRNWLVPTLETFQCAAIICHHTPKTREWNTSKWKQHQWVYAFAGNADIANTARAVIVIDPTDSPCVFKFVAAKRFRRIGWTDEAGDPAWIKYFRYKSEGGVIDWVNANEDEVKRIKTKDKVAAGSKDKYPPTMILKPLFELQDGMSSSMLLKHLNRLGCPIAEATLYRKLDKWQDDGFVETTRNLISKKREKGDDCGQLWTLTTGGLELFETKNR